MGSSGGGSASGRVDYPEYMKAWHINSLIGTDQLGVINIDLCDAMNYALDGASPYAGVVTLDADEVLLGAGKTLADFVTPFAYMSTYIDASFDSLFTGYSAAGGALPTYLANKEARLTAIATAESAMLEDELNATTLPAFKAGMRDIGACLSSAFVIGEANLRSTKLKALAKNDAIIRWEAEKLQGDLTLRSDELAMRLALSNLEIRRSTALMVTDLAKLYAAMSTELLDFNVENIAKDKLWDVKIFQYGGNFLGAIAGSAVSTDKGDSSKQKLQGTVGMAMAGASVGAYAGGPWGALAGAIVGGVAGYFTS